MSNQGKKKDNKVKKNKTITKSKSVNKTRGVQARRRVTANGQRKKVAHETTGVSPASDQSAILAHETPEKKPITFLFELEYFAIKGRDILFKVLSEVLAQKDIKLTFPSFVRHCLYPPASHYLLPILKESGKKRLSEEKLAMEIQEAFNKVLLDEAAKKNQHLLSLIAAVQSREIPVGAYSCLQGEIAGKLLEKGGYTELGVTVFSAQCEAAKVTPGAEAWLKLAKNIGTVAQKCVVLVTSERACRAALATGARCVVVPDAYTSFQDFGGADRVYDQLDADAVKDILAILDTK